MLSTLSYAIYSLFILKTSKRVWFCYILPAWLIAFGLVINFSINYLTNHVLIGHLGFILPWSLLLIIHTIVDREELDPKILWKYSYNLMLVIVLLGLFDYYLIYFLGSSAKVLNTPYGVFLAGKFSILHMLEDGAPHFRFYAAFAEAGSLGMMLLPFIVYSFLYKKYIGMIILGLGLYFSSSLGANISLVLLFTLLFLTKQKSRKNYFLLYVKTFFLVTLIILKIIPFFAEEIEKKDGSRITREESFKTGINNISEIFINNSFGLELANSTRKSEMNSLYSGSNFIPIIYLMKGGILSFIGYCIIIYFSIYDSIRILVSTRNIKKIDYIVALSLLSLAPFLVQRMTLWETPLFALLYFPTLLKKKLE